MTRAGNLAEVSCFFVAFLKFDLTNSDEGSTIFLSKFISYEMYMVCFAPIRYL